MSTGLVTPSSESSSTATLPRVTLIETVDGYRELLDAARASGSRVGLVPTMGALHDGHRALIDRAAAECDLVAVSVFVNPTQFGDPADLAAYPRDLESDLESAADAGADAVFAPSVEEMYPDWPTQPATTVAVPSLAARWEGASRPGHFEGVATVVTKLLSATGPCSAYFGEKDFQQLAIVRRLVRDLSIPVEIVGCPTVRCEDGLALSSRNARLPAGHRRAATVLIRALRAGASSIGAGERDPARVEAEMKQVVGTEPAVGLDYASVVDAESLEPACDCASEHPLRLLIAAEVGGVRLIDNLDPRARG